MVDVYTQETDVPPLCSFQSYTIVRFKLLVAGVCVERFGRKPILTDGALWYDLACRGLRLVHHVYDMEVENTME